MIERADTKFLGVRVVIQEAEGSLSDPRKCWIHRSRNYDGTEGNYEMRRWFSVETVSGMMFPTLRIILGKYSVFLYVPKNRKERP